MFERYVQQLRHERRQQHEALPDAPAAVAGSPAGAAAAGAARPSGTCSSSSSSNADAAVAVIPEGAACSASLLGLIRLVAWLAQQPALAAAPKLHLVLDCGTGATATGELMS